MALWLKRRGISRVKILAGGLQAWVDQGFPVVDWDEDLVEISLPAKSLVH